MAHEVQLVDSPRQVWHVELQLRHTPRPSVELTNWPMAQVDVHVPAPESKLTPETHDVQPVGLLSVHVAHEASQAVQVSSVNMLSISLSVNMPLGQAATQVPS